MKDCIGTTRYLMGKYPVEIVKCGEADFGEYVDECPEQQNCLRAKILQDCTITLMAVDYDEDGPKPDLVPLPDTLRKGEIRCFPAMWLHKKSSLKPKKLNQLDNSLIVFSVNKYRVELVSESVNWKDLVAIRNFINEKGSVRARGEKHEF